MLASSIRARRRLSDAPNLEPVTFTEYRVTLPPHLSFFRSEPWHFHLPSPKFMKVPKPPDGRYNYNPKGERNHDGQPCTPLSFHMTSPTDSFLSTTGGGYTR